jgi:hypothetical protein
MQQPGENFNYENNENNINENPEIKIEEQKPKKTFFQTHKEFGDPFFKTTRVNSCSHVLVKNGRCLAIPFGVTNRRKRHLNHFKTVPEKLSTNKTIYMTDYVPVSNLHCGMGLKKPLVPFSPDSARNLLPLNGIVSGAAANRSYLDLGNQNIINKKQFSTTYRDSFLYPRIVPISNSGICADMAKASHMRLNS